MESRVEWDSLSYEQNLHIIQMVGPEDLSGCLKVHKGDFFWSDNNKLLVEVGLSIRWVFSNIGAKALLRVVVQH